MLKTILLVLLAIIVIAFIYAYFAEKKFSIVSEIVINKSKPEVFEYTKLIKNQEKWSKWVMADPNIQIQYSGTDGEVGFKSAWQSDDKNVGVGEQEIMKINGTDGFEVEIRFKKPFEGISQAEYRLDSLAENQTKITTTFYSENPFPINLMIPIIKNMLKKDMDQNSANLKRQLEQ
ncbi:MAG: SRPBCC family protein [Bacteroidota bacterium]